jgi:hypothetical protein
MLGFWDLGSWTLFCKNSEIFCLLDFVKINSSV